MEPARNPLAGPEDLPEQNFATSPKRNFEHVNCSDDQTRVSSARPDVGPGWDRTGERKRGKQVYTTQVHNLVPRVLCKGFETKQGTRQQRIHQMNN